MLDIRMVIIDHINKPCDKGEYMAEGGSLRLCDP